jgi:hypothetical protein
MSNEEKGLLTEQTSQLRTISGLLNQAAGQNQEQQSIYKNLSGLYDQNGNLDQAKLADLRTKTEAFQKQADEISSLQSDRYLKALKGELPVSEGTLQRKAKDFQLLKESAARKGNVIQGNNPEGAYGLSSAAAANLGEFNRTYGLLQDAERRGEIASGGMGAAPGTIPLGYTSTSNAYSPASLIPGYSTLSSGYAAAAEPYANQRLLGYQAQLQQAALDSQSNPLGSLIGGAGTGAVTGFMMGGPMGAAVGAGIGGGAGYLGGRR